MVNASIWSANAVTHTKIILVSLAAAILFAAVGITAQFSNRNSASVCTGSSDALCRDTNGFAPDQIARLRRMLV
jgi:hypothetical protein